MAKPRTLAELEIEVFDWGLELKHCMTSISCEVCPETHNQKCPGNKTMSFRQQDSRRFMPSLRNGIDQKMAA
jgi:hypothetical protein